MPVNNITWTGVSNVKLLWAGGAGMIQYRVPVRNNVPQLLQYTFNNQAGVVIDLSTYVSCSLEIKLQGAVFSTIAAAIVAPATLGVVKLAAYTFTTTGIWTAQFYCVNGSANKLFGDLIEFTVVPNVEDLSLSQLPNY